jgi:hypothetical protein
MTNVMPGPPHRLEFTETEDDAPFPFSQDFDSRGEEQQDDDEYKGDLPHNDVSSVYRITAVPPWLLR